MSTRSTIWIENKNGTFDGIYCHWDGYPENNGVILYNHYRDEEKIRSLIGLGSLSSLGKYVSTNMPHTFDKPFPDVCVAYHRDRGEDFFSYSNVKKSNLGEYLEEYNYFFMDGEWKYTTDDVDKMKSLENALK